MPQHLNLFKISLGTFVLTRLFLFVTWQMAFMEGQKLDSWHHFYSGLLLFMASYLTKGKLNLVIAGVGLGLMIDEATVPLKLLGVFEPEYWSVGSWGISLILYLIWFFIIRADLSIAKPN